MHTYNTISHVTTTPSSPRPRPRSSSSACRCDIPSGGESFAPPLRKHLKSLKDGCGEIYESSNGVPCQVWRSLVYRQTQAACVQAAALSGAEPWWKGDGEQGTKGPTGTGEPRDQSDDWARQEHEPGERSCSNPGSGRPKPS